MQATQTGENSVPGRTVKDKAGEEAIMSTETEPSAQAALESLEA